MNIGIIGAGSIGLLFASYLSTTLPVTLYTRTDKQAHEVNKFGVICQKGDQQTKFSVNALPIAMWEGKEELTIIAVKQYQLEAIISQINELPTLPNNLLFLQNGMGHLKLLKNLRSNNIFVGSVEHGALKENAYTVCHNGEGAINAAIFQGDSAILHHFSKIVPIEFPITIKNDYYEMLLNKLVVNAVINPLTAILHVKNGELLNNPFYFSALRNLFAEISSILNLEQPEEKLMNIIEICKRTADNRSSMLKDLEANRKTEVDAILGFLIDEAKRQVKQAPQVESVYLLVKGKEMG